MSNDIYSRLSTYGGIAGEYVDINESTFSSAAGSAYTPPERGTYRRSDGVRRVQVLQECPVVIETFQTSAGIIRLPANTLTVSTNDAGDGRIFFLRNSGTGTLTIQDYLGTTLYYLVADQITIIFGNTANEWDFVAASPYLLSPGTNINFSTPTLSSQLINAFTLQSSTTTASTYMLLSTSDSQQVFVGTTAGQSVDLPDATTLDVGRLFVLWNNSTQNIVVNNNTGAMLFNLPANYRAIVTVTDISTIAGQWSWMLITESSTPGLSTKAGIIPAVSFTGSPKTATVTFATSFSSSGYSITLTGIDKRSWSYESKTSGGFTINANASQALTDEVSWQALLSGETI